MPVHRPATVNTEAQDGVCGPVTLLRFSDDGGLTQFGAFVEILPPGSRSSIKHWHSAEDEMVYVLSGEVTLHEGDAASPVRAGEAATFRAGVAAGHCLENTGTEPASYLVIGTRTGNDIVTYPDNDCILIREDGGHRWTDLAGRPSDSPYRRRD